MRDEERTHVRSLQQRSFNVPYRLRSKPPEPATGELRVAELDGTIVAALRVMRFGHFFGGRAVPAAGIGGVAVAPEARGHRVAEQMMIETMRELHAAGVPLSALYPATVPLYRRVGYEYGGFRIRYRAALRNLPRAGDLECVPWGDEDFDQIEACYRSWASGSSGPIDRPRGWWNDRILSASEEEDLFRVCVREDGQITGYMIYTQQRHPPSEWQFDLDMRDFVWTTQAAATAILTYAGRHRSNALDLIWTGPPNDPLANLLPEQDADRDSWFRPMFRLVDVPGALEARGYPPAINAAVELRVKDPGVPANDAGWRLEVSGGEGKVAPTSAAAPSVDVGTLSAIWSGMLPARDAQRLGRLAADDDTVQTMDQLFAGPFPWINDWF